MQTDLGLQFRVRFHSFVMMSYEILLQTKQKLSFFAMLIIDSAEAYYSLMCLEFISSWKLCFSFHQTRRESLGRVKRTEKAIIL